MGWPPVSETGDIIAATSRSLEAIAVAREKDKKRNNGSLGQRLAELRKLRGITQVELAKELGLTQALISQYENDEVRLHGELILKLAKMLGVTCDELLGGKQTKERGGIRNRRLHRYMEQIDQLPKRDQQALLRTINTFLKGAQA